MDFNNNGSDFYQGGWQPDQQIEKENRQKLNRRFVSGILVGFLCAALGISACLMVLMYRNSYIRNSIKQPVSELLNETTLSKIESLESVIDTYYYKEDIDKQEEANGLYKGLMDSLGDPYTVYYTESELEKLMSDTKGVYYGIGAYVSLDTTINMPRISGVIAGSPAESSNLCINDVIFEVDGTSTQGLSLEEVVTMIKGEAGSKVHLSLVRTGEADNVEVDVVRREIEVPTINTKVLDNNIGYLQITEFDEITTAQFIEGMADLRSQNIEGLIIDLRSNPGGSLATVCDIARQLLPKGNIVYTEDRDGNRENYTCDGKNEIDIPMVVLVNQYSASASEILAGALKDYEKATLVGTTTYGKGIVQRIFDLRDGTAVKMTVSSYFTPNGVNIHGVGIAPDVEVELDSEAYAKDKTDNQLDKAIEVMKDLLDK